MEDDKLERAWRALRAILALADSALSGRVTLTNEPIFDTEQHRYYWRSVMGLIWSHAHEGLGLDLPRPPAWPPEPPRKPPCPRGMSGPCEDCPYFPGNLANYGKEV